MNAPDGHEEGDRVVGAPAASARASAGGIRVSMRHYFSTYLLFAAEDAAARAGHIEAAHRGRSRFDVHHNGLVLTTIVNAASFLEAMINELYQDAHDGHGIRDDGYIAPLDDRCREILAELWANTDHGLKLRSLEKYQLLLLAADKPRLEPGAQPYQDASSLIFLRNVIAHYQPEHTAADVESRIQKRLRGKFPDNALMHGSGNPWWPSHCLGHGCASWACDSALALADDVVNAVGVTPNYQRLRASHWKGFTEKPGGEVDHPD